MVWFKYLFIVSMYLEHFFKLPGGPKKNWTKLSVTILVVWQLLSGAFFNPPDALCLWQRRKYLLLLSISKWLRRETVEWECLLLHAGHKWDKHCRSCKTVYVAKKCIDDGEGVNWPLNSLTSRRGGKSICLKWVLLRVAVVHFLAWANAVNNHLNSS